MRLVFDLGNTRGKWALFEGASILARGDFPTPSAAVAHDWEAILPEVEAGAVAIGSVLGPAHREPIAVACRRRYASTPRFLSSRAEALGVQSAYRRPETLGIDRWAALVAARGRTSNAVCIASVGTALTLDCLDPDGRHLGGWIAPGPAALSSALEASTRDVHFDRLRPSRAWGHDTEECVEAGLFGALVALVEDGYRRLVGRHAEAELWLTGGASTALGGLLECAYRAEPDLVLLGLEALAREEGAP